MFIYYLKIRCIKWIVPLAFGVQCIPMLKKVPILPMTAFMTDFTMRTKILNVPHRSHFRHIFYKNITYVNILLFMHETYFVA